MQRDDRRHRLLAGATVGVLAIGWAVVCFGQSVKPAAPPPGSTPSAGAAAGNPPATAGTAFQSNQAVEVRPAAAGNWAPATVLKREGRRYQVRYANGTDEWVTADRLRSPQAGGGPGQGVAPAPAAAPAPGAAPAAAAAAGKEQYAVGAKVEAKHGGFWHGSTVKSRDGDLYLVARDEWPAQFHWLWVHVSMVRARGDTTKVGHDALGVAVANNTIAQAKAQAKEQFANVNADIAEANAARDREFKAPRNPIDEVPYDKPVTPANLATVRDMPIGRVAAKPLAAETADPALAKLSGKPVVLRGAASDDVFVTTKVVFGGPWVLASHRYEPPGNKPKQSRVERVNLATAVAEPVVAGWDPGSDPVALSPSGRRVLGRRTKEFGFGTENRVDLWDLPSAAGATPAQPKHLVSFVPYDHLNAGEKDVLWASLVDDEHALTYGGDGELIYWKVGPAIAIAVWRTDLTGGDTLPILSTSGQRLAAVIHRGLVVLEVSTGEPLALIPQPRRVRGLAFCPDGNTVAGIELGTLTLWDLGKGQSATDIGLDRATRNQGHSVQFAGPGHVIVGHSLIDLSRKSAVWSLNGVRDDLTGHAGRAWTTVLDLTAQERRVVLVSAGPPAESVRRATAAAGSPAALLGPGTTVSLEVTTDGPEEQRKLLADALAARLRQNNVSVAEGQPVRLVARATKGKTRGKVYPAPKPGGVISIGYADETVTHVAVEVGGKVVWEGDGVHVPPFVRPAPGQTPKEAAAAAPAFDPAFVRSVPVPAFVPRPDSRLYLGSSSWGPTGVIDAN